MKEFSKTDDYNPSKTIYLIKLELDNLYRHVFQRLKHSVISICTIQLNLTLANEGILQKYHKFQQVIKDKDMDGISIDDLLTSGEKACIKNYETKMKYLDCNLIRILPTILCTEMKLSMMDSNKKF